jgi:hypothetical protein
MLDEAGFGEVRISARTESREFIKDWMPGSGVENYIVSATIEAVKPVVAKTCCGPACCTPEASS